MGSCGGFPPWPSTQRVLLNDDAIIADTGIIVGYLKEFQSTSGLGFDLKIRLCGIHSSLAFDPFITKEKSQRKSGISFTIVK
jgi:hypothetical protein